MSFRSLAFSFRMGVSTVSGIVRETVELIWNVLLDDHMPIPTEETFKKISDDYYRLWNFPNCVGTLDGKHIRIRCPSHSGSMFHNYKGFFSIVLQALVDANYKFISIDVGGYGKQSDGGTFRASGLHQRLLNGTLQLPENSVLPESNTNMPYVMLADEAYPLMRNLLTPYRKQDLDPSCEYFNKRLSRARRTVEHAFGIIRAKWEILDKSISTNVTLADKIVKAICVLHNTIIDKEGVEHNLQEKNLQYNHRPQIPVQRGRLNAEAKHIRDVFKTYLCQHPH